MGRSSRVGLVDWRQRRRGRGGAGGGGGGVQVASNRAAQIQPAYCLGYVGMYDEAQAWFERVLEEEPNDFYALHALVNFSVANDDYPEARRWAVRARESGASSVLGTYFIAFLEIAEGNLETAASLLREVVQSEPGLNSNGTPTAEVVLAWVLAESGRPEGRERLEALRGVRLERVAEGHGKERIYRDLAIIASVLDSPDEQLRWFLEASREDRIRDLYEQRDFPWMDPLRDVPEFQAWRETVAAEVAAQRRELEALGPWIPAAVLGVAGR